MYVCMCKTTSSKERQGQTLGVRFSELSVIESTKRYKERQG